MSKELQTLDMSLPINSLDAYISQVNRLPMLTAEQEYQLATDLQENNDIEAARHLVLSHLRFVVKVARDYSGYGLALGDLIQEGNVGLMKAVKRFDPNVGVRLVSYAVHWIKSEIHEFVIRNWRIVKVATTKPQRKLFFNLRKNKKRLGWFSEQEIKYVADSLNVSTKDVKEMEKRLNGQDVTFEAPSDDDDKSQNTYAPALYLEDKRANPETQLISDNWMSYNSQRLAGALEQLDERSQVILQERWLSEDKTTLTDLAHRYNISAERVRQLENIAIQKLKDALIPDSE